MNEAPQTPVSAAEPGAKVGIVLLVAVVVALLVVGGFFAFGGTGEEGRVRTTVVTTIPPLTWLAQQVAGERLKVHGILPAGASPHTHELRPSDAVAIEAAYVLFHVDSDLDGWATKVEGSPKLALLHQLLPSSLLEMDAHDEGGHDDHHDHNHGQFDPHYWLDPSLFAQSAQIMANDLAARDPEGAETYAANAARVVAELMELDREVAAMLEPFKGKGFVQFHPAFGYFFKRYGLVSLGSVEAFAGTSPAPSYLAKLKRKMHSEGAAGIFIEPQLSSQAAEALAEGGDVSVIRVDPLGGQVGQSYPDLIRANARAIVEAFRDR